MEIEHDQFGPLDLHNLADLRNIRILPAERCVEVEFAGLTKPWEEGYIKAIYVLRFKGVVFDVGEVELAQVESVDETASGSAKI